LVLADAAATLAGDGTILAVAGTFFMLTDALAASTELLALLAQALVLLVLADAGATTFLAIRAATHVFADGDSAGAGSLALLTLSTAFLVLANPVPSALLTVVPHLVVGAKSSLLLLNGLERHGGLHHGGSHGRLQRVVGIDDSGHGSDGNCVSGRMCMRGSHGFLHCSLRVKINEGDSIVFPTNSSTPPFELLCTNNYNSSRRAFEVCVRSFQLKGKAAWCITLWSVAFAS
jgi:hypothetical protein